MAEKSPEEQDDLFDDSVLDEVVDLDAETPHPDIEPPAVSEVEPPLVAEEEEEVVETLDPVDDFEVTEELGDTAAEEFEVAEPDEFQITEEAAPAADGFEVTDEFEETPPAAPDEEFTEEETPVDDLDQPEEAAGDAFEEEEFTEEEAPTDDEFTEEAAADEEFAEEEAPADEEDFTEEEEPVDEETERAGPRRGGAADRYQKTAKPPPSKGRKRVMAALILALPVMLVGIIIAGFFIKQPYYPDIDGSPEVHAWQKMLIMLKISDPPPRPEIARPPVDDEPETPPDTLVQDYQAEQRRVVREIGADILQGRLEGELAEKGLTEPDKELKKKYFWEADKIVKSIEAAENRLKLIWADMEAKKIEGIVPQKHTELMGDLLARRTEMEAFREANKPSSGSGTESTVTPKDPSPRIAEYDRTFDDGKAAIRDAAALRADLQTEQGGGALTRELAQKYFNRAGESIVAIGNLETAIKNLMAQMESEAVDGLPAERHQTNLEELAAMRASLEQFQSDCDPQKIPMESPLVKEYGSAFTNGRDELVEASALRSALQAQQGGGPLTRELAQTFHATAGRAIEDVDRLIERLNTLVAQMEASDVPTAHADNLEALAAIRRDLATFRDEVNPESIVEMPAPSPLPGEYAQVWESRNLQEAAVLRSNLRAELGELGLEKPDRMVAGKHWDLAGQAIAAVDAFERELNDRMSRMESENLPDRPTDAHAEHLAELGTLRRELKAFRDEIDPTKIAVAPPPAVEDTPLKQFEALREKLNRAGLDESIAILQGYLEAGPEDRFRGWAEGELARLETIRADRAAREAPETPKKTPDDLIREGTELVVKCAEAIKRLIKTEIPDDTTAQLALRLESEDVLAGLDDAQFKYARALEQIKDDPDRAEDVEKLETSLTRIRQLRKAFSEDFVKRLDHKTGG